MDLVRWHSTAESRCYIITWKGVQQQSYGAVRWCLSGDRRVWAGKLAVHLWSKKCPDLELGGA